MIQPWLSLQNNESLNSKQLLLEHAIEEHKIVHNFLLKGGEKSLLTLEMV